MNEYTDKMTIKQLAAWLRYDRPIDLTRELADRGVLIHNNKKYDLTEEALKDGIGQVGIKDVGYGNKVGFNLFNPERIKNLLKSYRRLIRPEEIKPIKRKRDNNETDESQD